jgi:hypothetical protein
LKATVERGAIPASAAEPAEPEPARNVLSRLQR